MEDFFVLIRLQYIKSGHKKFKKSISLRLKDFFVVPDFFQDNYHFRWEQKPPRDSIPCLANKVASSLTVKKMLTSSQILIQKLEPR